LCPHRAQRPHLISSHILQASLIRRAVAYSFCMNSVSCGKHSCTCLAMHHALLGHTYTRMLGHASCTCLAMHHALLGHTYTRMLGHASCTCLVMPLVGHASCTAWSVMHHALLGQSCIMHCLVMHYALLGHAYGWPCIMHRCLVIRTHVCIGLARTTYGTFVRQITKYAVIHNV